jgi:uncharacterized integral membrane protein
MLPGGFAAKAILVLFALTAQDSGTANEMLITGLSNPLHVVTLGALAPGVAIPALLLMVRRTA